MTNYKLIKKGIFERESSFEERLNSLALEGWRAISITKDSGILVVLMQKSRQPMAKKKAFALRLNEDLMKAVEKWAADEFRSTNGQLEWMISESLKKAKRLKKKDD